MREHHIVILGGGITGLVAAYRLSQIHRTGELALRCTVCEQDDRFGGKIHTRRTDAYTLELGPDSIYTRKPEGIELIRELGLSADIVPVRPSGGTFIWHNQRLQPLPQGLHSGVPSDLRALAQTDLLSLAGKRRALDDLLLPAEPCPDDVSLGQFLRKRLGDEVVNVIASPLLAGIHAGDINRMSLDATMPMLRTLYEEQQSLVLGMMAMAQRQKAIMPTSPPKPMFVSLRNGLEQLVDGLLGSVQSFADLRLQTRALQVTAAESGKYNITLLHSGERETLEADAVVIATPSNVAASLLSGVGLDGTLLNSIRFASTATISFRYNEPLSHGEMTGSGFLVPRNEGTTITACTVVSNKWSHAVKNGGTLIRCYVGRDGSEEAVGWTDDRLIQEVQQDLQQTLHLTAEPDFVEIKRWHSAMPQFDVGHLVKVDKIETALASLPGIALAGAAYRGVGIPDCIRDASRAVDQVKNHLTQSHSAPMSSSCSSRKASSGSISLQRVDHVHLGE